MEYSQPWDGSDVGHAASRANYLADEWDEMYETWFGSLGNNGTILGIDNELAVAVVGANTVSVDTGCAMARGKWYRNTVIINDINVPSATAGNWREDCICLRANWTAKTVVVYRHENNNENVAWDNADLDQTHGTIWEIPLGNARVTDAGVVTLYDNVFAIYGPDPDLFIGMGEMIGSGGSPADWDDGTGWKFDSVTDETVTFSFRIPAQFRGEGFRVWVIWYGAGAPANSDAVGWIANFYITGCGEVTAINGTRQGSFTISSILQLHCSELVIDGFWGDPLSPADPRDYVRCHLSRDADGSVVVDDYGHDAILWGVRFRLL